MVQQLVIAVRGEHTIAETEDTVQAKDIAKMVAETAYSNKKGVKL